MEDGNLKEFTSLCSWREEGNFIEKIDFEEFLN
jgi:hypothetical protein